MKLAIFAGAALSYMAATVHADTSGEEERFVINKLGESDFEVIRLQQMGTAELWCAAASYVETRINKSETSPIYVRSPLGPARTVQGREGVVFSLSNAGLSSAEKRITLTVDVPGAMLKSAVARGFCRDAFTRSTK